jgi:uncharacterized OB-fold protein
MPVVKEVSGSSAAGAAVSICDDVLSTSLDPAGEWRLGGARCGRCGQVTLGASARTCPNCSSPDMTAVALSTTGVLWSYTVVRHQPPGDAKLPIPFQPFGVGLVELDEGIRVVAPLADPTDRLRIGMTLELEVLTLYVDDDGRRVMAFRFREPVAAVVQG